MTEKPEHPRPAVADLIPTSDSGSAGAPIIYFENVPTFGNIGPMIRLTLTAERIYPGATTGQLTVDRVVVAHLRASVQSAMELKLALDKALLMVAPTESSAKN